MKETRYVKAARRAVEGWLADQKEPVSLFSVSCVADDAARNLGRKSGLYSSLYDYEVLLSAGWRSRWLTADGGSGDSMLMAVPAGWRDGDSDSHSLLLGRGPLVGASAWL